MIIFFKLKVFFAAADFPRLIGKKISGKYQVELFQKFYRVQILEGSTVIFSQTIKELVQKWNTEIGV